MPRSITLAGIVNAHDFTHNGLIDFSEFADEYFARA